MKASSITSFLLGLLVVTYAQTQWYYDHWCGSGMQYLDDSKCAKIFPKSYDRDYTCRAKVYSSPPAGYVMDGDLHSMPIDVNSFVVSDADINLCLILTKRVANASAASGVTLYNKYYCSGTKSRDEAFETWSSSKIFTMANAAGHLRTKEPNCPNSQLGLDSSTTGKHSDTLLGDLATVVCSYDTTAGYSSNGLSSYFHDLGWRQRLHDEVLVNWLLKGNNSKGETLGGNYGESTPSDLSFTLTPPSAPSCPAERDPWPYVYDNTLSSLSAAEMTRRLALFREVGEGQKFPGVTWTDVQEILYGASTSALFPSQLWGGMTADPAIFLQSSPSLSPLLGKVPDFRIFSKLGNGWSSSRSRGEMVNSAHLCLPSWGGGGIELSINVRGSVVGDSSGAQVEKKLLNAMMAGVEFALALTA